MQYWIRMIAVVCVLGGAFLSATALAQDSDLSLNRLLIARAVAEREPQGTEGPFEASLDRVFVYMDVANRTGSEQELTVVWQEQGSEETHDQTITVGVSGRWRTWVTIRVSERRVGRWHVEVRASDGTVLAETNFEISEG